MVTCVGEALIDFIPRSDETGGECFRPSPGGSPFNTAITLGRLAVPTAYLSKLSRDFFGDMLAERLSENGVDIRRVQRSDQPTTLAFVSRDESGDARYAFYAENAADRSLSDEDLPGTLPEEAQCLLFGSISILMEPAASTISRLIAREAGKRVISFDPNVRENLIPDRDAYRRHFETLAASSTILKLSDDDLRWIYPKDSVEAATRRLLGLGTRLVVITRGAEGSSAVTEHARASAPAEDTTIADTIGAGDSFHGGFIAWLYHHERLSLEGIGALGEGELEAALRYAAKVSGITCARHGADPPTTAELDAQ